jgi:hypothetical protein
VTLFAKVEIDLATGAATLITSETILGPQNPTTINPSAGFASISQYSPGPGPDIYVLHLQDPYVRLIGFSAVEDQSEQDPLLPYESINNFRTLIYSDVNDQTDPLVEVILSNAPITGGAQKTVVLFAVTLANSTAL